MLRLMQMNMQPVRFGLSALFAACALALAACGSSEKTTLLNCAYSSCAATQVEAETLAYAESVELASAPDDEAILPFGVGAAPPASASLVDLISNGSFNDPSGPSTGWTQRTNRTRFGNLGEIIGDPISGNPPAPTNNVARLCGYPFMRGDVMSSDRQNCFDRLSKGGIVIPANATSLTLQADVLGRFACTGTSNYAQLLLRPVDGGPQIAALSVKISSLSVNPAEIGKWTAVSATVNDPLMLQKIQGKQYEFNIIGNTAGCMDPDMSQTYVQVTNIRLIATTP